MTSILNKFFKKKFKTLKDMDQLVDIQKAIHKFNNKNKTKIGLIQIVDKQDDAIQYNSLGYIADVILSKNGDILKNRFF